MTAPATQVSRSHQSFAVTAAPHDIHRWRQLVTGVLAEWGAARAAVELACFGVSELLSNIIRHAGDRRCRLTLERTGSVVTVSVLDRSPRLPVVTEPEWDAESGRGLWLLRHMAGPGDFGHEPAAPPWGKAVWFRCHLTDPCRHPELTPTAEGRRCTSCGALIYLTKPARRERSPARRNDVPDPPA
ncbi:ATP-binding protein [Streptomyces specialis]|uniref:ATP-binding protein n=1 Tax=Streptomyces specialis TaxID=498367 RepID=UPI00099EA918|nr:ATP-binding protein [Streptomyces specialis]